MAKKKQTKKKQTKKKQTAAQRRLASTLQIAEEKGWSKGWADGRSEAASEIAPRFDALTEASERDRLVTSAADVFVQRWLAHPRNAKTVGVAHAELIRRVLNWRVETLGAADPIARDYAQLKCGHIVPRVDGEIPETCFVCTAEGAARG